jgi:hypothetical protein
MVEKRANALREVPVYIGMQPVALPSVNAQL